jgi:hypothetical protein
LIIPVGEGQKKAVHTLLAEVVACKEVGQMLQAEVGKEVVVRTFVAELEQIAEVASWVVAVVDRAVHTEWVALVVSHSYKVDYKRQLVH